MVFPPELKSESYRNSEELSEWEAEGAGTEI